MDFLDQIVLQNDANAKVHNILPPPAVIFRIALSSRTLLERPAILCCWIRPSEIVRDNVSGNISTFLDDVATYRSCAHHGHFS